MITPRQILMFSLFLCLGMAGALWAQSGIQPYQDVIDVDPGSRGFNTYVNVVKGNLIHMRPELYIPGRGLPLTVVSTYNSSGSEDSPFGYGWQMNYNLQCQVNAENGDITIVRADGRRDAFIKQTDQTFAPTLGIREQLEPWGQGYRLLVWSDQTHHQGDLVAYTFDANDLPRLSTLSDRNGNQFRFTYNEQGQLSRVTDGIDRELVFSYELNKLVQITDQAGRQWHYQYNPDGDMIRATNPMGGTTEYSYSPTSHLLESIQDARGNTYQFLYDDHQVTRSVNPFGDTVVTLTYGANGSNQTRVTDAKNNTTRYHYGKEKRVITIVDALGYSRHRTWDDKHRLIALIGQNGHTTRTTYDPNSNPLTETDALGNTKTYTWDTRCHKTASITDRNGNITRFQYDARGNLLETIDALGGTTAFTYDAAGNCTSSTNANGHVTTYVKDADSRLLMEINALGAATQDIYNTTGKLVSQIDAQQRIQAYTYDSLNRLIEATDPLGDRVVYTYDGVGNLTQTRDKNDNTTQYTYDALNRTISLMDALGGTTRYSYDAVGNLISITNPNHETTTFAYDALNRMVKRTSPLGKTWQYAYDGVGHLIQSTDAKGQFISYTYDSCNRRIRTTYPDGHIDWSYDSGGNLVAVDNQSGLNEHTKMAYDALNRIVSSSVDYHDFLPVQTVSYTYDAAGNRKSMTYPDGEITSYTYDAAERLAEVHAFDGLTRYQYDALAQRAGTTYPNGMQVDYGYDALGRSASLAVTDGTGTVLVNRRYTYADAGANLSETHIGETTSRQVLYDALGRVVQAIYIEDGATDVQQVSYDAVGRRSTMTVNGQVTTYQYDSDGQLLQETGPGGTTTYTYDQNGNRLEKHTGPDTITYAYDIENRLVRVERPDPFGFGENPTRVRSYQYSALGQQGCIVDWDRPVYYVYDNDEVIVEQASGYQVIYNPHISLLDFK